MHTPRAEDIERLPAAELAACFVIGDLFEPGEIRLALTDLDRFAVGGAVPEGELALPPCPEFGTRYFTERRELGILNIGAEGSVRVGGESFALAPLDCLYVGTGEEKVVFASGSSGQAVFYFLSCPAHAQFPTARATKAQAAAVELGDEAHASKRWIRKYIHPQGVRSCQLTMGYTELAPGSVWNTMPAHTHARRSEIYFYFGLEDGMVVHLLGRPDRTRHVIARNRQAVLSPPWSVHAGAGTRSYSFVWGMAGENQDFADMDAVNGADLR
ncbi:MAG: 5-dehydro-4-deoxy-D-glucuronate isomerase [Acidobacteria bacterium]|nr:5-dehydro-4-deoxy-D-glucuronate isomerase [Acidobacteriota bacterium]